MTESEWLACTDPQKMLEFLLGKASDRKLRLFTCAYCRHILQDNKAVQVAERFADGLATNAERKHSRNQAIKAAISSELAGRGGINTLMSVADSAIARILCPPSRLYRECGTLPTEIVAAVRGVNAQASNELQQTQVMVLRDTFGNPFCPASLDPTVLFWHNAAVGRLAQAAYDERQMPAGTLDNGRLAVLADALEEAGCNDPDILHHLRGPGPHVRGCWVVDTILGKT
jgi:hypothetical protein